MTNDDLVVVHGDIVYLGGEFDYDTGRAYFGGQWEDRIDAALKEYENTTAIAYLDEATDGSIDDELVKRPRELRDQTHLPYSFQKYDNILEDPNNGAINEQQLEQITSDTEELTVAGVWLNNCVTTLIDNVIEYDENIEVKVDPEYTAVRPNRAVRKGNEDLEKVINQSIRELEMERANSPPSAKQHSAGLNQFESHFRGEDRVGILEEKNPSRRTTNRGRNMWDSKKPFKR